MKRLVAAIFSALPLWGIAAEDLQCDRVFEAGPNRELCVTVSLTRPRWTNEELRVAVEYRRTSEQERQANATQREILRTTLQATANKSNAMHLKLLMPGMSLKKVRELYPFMGCSNAETADEPASCLYTPVTSGAQEIKHLELESLAEYSVSTWLIKFAPGEKLAYTHVSMSSAAFDDVTKALIAKYGKPTTITVIDLQNDFGVKFKGGKLQWRRGDTFLQVTEYAGSRDYMSVVLASAGAIQALERFEARKVKKAAKDL